jgi:hypothetical protein
MKLSLQGIARRSMVSPETDNFRAASLRRSQTIASSCFNRFGFAFWSATSGSKYRRRLRVWSSSTSHFQRIFPSMKFAHQGIERRLTVSPERKMRRAASLRDNQIFIFDSKFDEVL